MSGRRRSASIAPAEEPASRQHPSFVFSLACGALFLTRFLIPTEATDDGHTLWIVIAWLLLGAASSWLAIRNERFCLRLGWTDAAVGTLVLGHLIAAVPVLVLEGNKRATLNLFWEWIGIAAAYLCLRHAFDDVRSRRRLRTLLLTAGVLLSLLGIWQRVYWYPRMRSAYLEYQQLVRDHSLDAARINELRRELGPEMLSLEGPQKIAFEQRLLHSNDVFGPFALANTFGGVLAVLLILAVAEFVRCRAALPRWLRVVGVLACLLIATTLVLTKSRSAILAAIIGLTLLTLRHSRRLHWPTRWLNWTRGLLIAGSLTLMLTLLGLMTGVVDREVLTEAPKSLQYRIHYWTGTWGVIRESPWLGIGPGNFANAYLKHKLPEASEEIADPHNLFFDAWVNGGLLALVGLLSIVRLMWTRALPPATTTSEPPPPQTVSRDHRWILLAGLLAFGLVGLEAWLLHGRVPDQLLVLAIGWPVPGWVMTRWTDSVDTPAPDEDMRIAGLVLVLHLCVAGGLAMPAVLLLLLTVSFVLQRQSKTMVHLRTKPELATGYAVVSTALLAVLGCLWTGWNWVTLSNWRIQSGRYELLVRGAPRAALEDFHAAAIADRLSPQPWLMIAGVHMQLWESAAVGRDEHLHQTQLAFEEAIERNPGNPHTYRLLGEFLLKVHRRTGSVAASEAVAALEEAVRRFPNSSAIRASLAQAHAAAGDTQAAAREAQIALKLDDINREWRHVDRFLTDELREEIRQLATGDGRSRAPD